MKLDNIYNIVLEPLEPIEKEKKIEEILSKLEENVNDIDRRLDIKFVFKKGKIVKIIRYYKYLDIHLRSLLLDLLITSVKRFLSPNYAAQKSISKYEDSSREFLNTVKLKNIIDFLDLNKNIKQEDFIYSIVKAPKEKLEEDEFYVTGIYNPSIKILSYVSLFNFIETSSLKIVRSDKIKENEVILTNLPNQNSYKNTSILDKSKKEKVILESSLATFYKNLDKNYKFNVIIKFKFVKGLTNFQKVKVFSFLSNNGLEVTSDNYDIMPVSINSFELFALLSGGK